MFVFLHLSIFAFLFFVEFTYPPQKIVNIFKSPLLHFIINPTKTKKGRIKKYC